MKGLIRIPTPYVKVGITETSLQNIFQTYFGNQPTPIIESDSYQTYIDHKTIMCDIKIQKNEFDKEFIPYLESMGYLAIGNTDNFGYQLYHKPNSKKVPFIHYRSQEVSDKPNLTSLEIDSLTLKNIRNLGLEKDIIDLYKTFNRLIINLSPISYFRQLSLRPINVLNQRKVMQKHSSSLRR
jgi:hypothetical protein